jgi:hypothetical protein
LAVRARPRERQLLDAEFADVSCSNGPVDMDEDEERESGQPIRGRGGAALVVEEDGERPVLPLEPPVGG